MRAVNPAGVLGTVAALRKQVHQTGSGVYLLTGYKKISCKGNQSRLQLTLEDATGRLTAHVWPEALDAVLIPPMPAPVAVQAKVQIYDDRPQLKLMVLAGLDSAAVPRATDLLPRHRCPENALPAFDRLALLERSLPPPLDGFLREVLLDPVIGMAFVRCRASVRHHHSAIGGLLVHSTELLDIAGAITRYVLPADAWSPHLAQLGYLLHDLGKLRSVGELRRPDFALTVRHEVMSIEMIAPHLRWLERREPKLAQGLRAVFDYLAIPHKARTIPNYFVPQLVANLDQLSAASFESRDLDHFVLHGARPTLHKPLNALDAANDALHDTEVRHAG